MLYQLSYASLGSYYSELAPLFSGALPFLQHLPVRNLRAAGTKLLSETLISKRTRRRGGLRPLRARTLQAPQSEQVLVPTQPADVLDPRSFPIHYGASMR